MNQYVMSLRDSKDEKNIRDVCITEENGTLSLAIEGCSTFDQKHGAPIYLELYNNKILLYMYQSVLVQDPLIIEIQPEDKVI